MKNPVTIEQLKKITGIDDFSELTAEESERLLKLIGEQKLNEKQISALIEIAPHFIGCAKEALATVGKAAEAAKENQKEALAPIVASVAGISKILELLAEKAESDEARLKIAEILIDAGRLYLEFAKICENMNKDNNTFFLKVVGVAGTLATLALTVLVVISGGKGGGPNKA